MPTWKHHVFVCTNKRPPGHPKGSCGERGCNDVLMALNDEVERLELFDTVKVNSSSCLGPCRAGPMMVVYPENTWYGAVKAEDVREIVQSHFVGGKPVTRLVLPES
ncbi:MAG: (2Fe-2S) ferredoxin domain-containing protein [Pseudomonadota bacterium]|nr:(2Fe-2S) ferredoxin domain-containing protein [Pseudomonadota bacterium]